MAADSQLRTLGAFELKVGDAVVLPLPTHKARALVTLLVFERGRDVGRERLLENFWDGFEPERAREGLRTTLSFIRTALRRSGIEPDDLFSANKSAVRWVAATQSDVQRFLEGTRSQTPAERRAAIELYAGEFLEGNYEEWVVAQQERLASAYETLLASVVALTDDAEAARLLLARNPYDEAAYATLIQAELDANRLSGAARLLARYRAAMTEIGCTPSEAFASRFASVAVPADENLTIPFVARTGELAFFERAFRRRLGHHGIVALVRGELGIGKTALLEQARTLAQTAARACLFIRCAREEAQGTALWRSLQERMAGIPAILFVDDAHLLEGESLDVFGAICRQAQTHNHVVTAALRPEGSERIVAALYGCEHQLFGLGPLERADIETAFALAIGDDRPDFVEALYARSQGHPLFFNALLQSLVQKRVVKREYGRWHLVRETGERLDLPPNLRVSIESRVRAAGDDAAAVACALALEPAASAEELAAALAYPESRVYDALDQLMNFGLVRESDRSAGLEFAHDIVRGVAAGVLNPGRRVALHRAFARRFEQSDAPEATLRLARHLRAAGMAMQAAHAYLKTARAALERYAFRDARDRCSDAMHAIERLERNAEWKATMAGSYGVRAQAAEHLGEVSDALDAANEAVRHARASERGDDIARAVAIRASLYGAFGDVARQSADALELTEAADATDQPTVRVHAIGLQALAAYRSGDAQEALRLAQAACSAAQTSVDFSALYYAYETLLLLQSILWRFNDARRTLEPIHTAAERAGAAAQARLAWVLAVYEYLSGKPENAAASIASALRLLQIVEQRGDTAAPDLTYPVALIAFTAQYLDGFIASVQERWDEALAAALRCRGMGASSRFPATAWQ